MKVVFVGNSALGKTAVARFLLNGVHENLAHIPTIGAEVHPVFRNGKTFHIWDCAGLEKFGCLRTGYYIATQKAFVFEGGDEAKTNKFIAELLGENEELEIVRVSNGTLQQKINIVEAHLNNW